MHENVKKQVDEILSKIPADTGLTDDEVRLELAMKIVGELDEKMDLTQEKETDTQRDRCTRT